LWCLRITTTERFWSWAARGALALYCLWAGLLIMQNPGLQYDEALLVLGSVHMRNAGGELPLPHDPNTWFCMSGRCFPLMTVRYVGAIKEYLCLPLFAALGPSAQGVRIVSMLLGLLGLYGIATLIARQVSPAAAAISGCAIAMNPAYVDLTVFDNGTVAIWMGALGVLCLALQRYLHQKDSRSAFWLGMAMGLGVWARANFVWLLFALFAATLIVLRRRALAPPSHWAAAAFGVVVGCAPFLLYQVISRGGTWQAIGMFSSHEPLRKLLSQRLVMFSETLLSDWEHRSIWGAAQLPYWQRWLFPAVVLVSCLVCLSAGSEWGRLHSRSARLVTLIFLFLGAFLFLSRMPVGEHHLIVLVPLAAIVTVFACFILASQYRRGRAVACGLAIVYLSSATYWQVSAVQGLSNSGGIGQWSDAVFPLTAYLQKRYPDKEIKILDWGLQNNLYVLSDGEIRSREIYENASRYPRGWMDQIRLGGVFLMNGPANRQFPAASTDFLNALFIASPPMRRFTVNQRSGVPYAEIIEIKPIGPNGN
jgi:Dolichyl-phosphate-mannose-protein mannosyltransferase